MITNPLRKPTRLFPRPLPRPRRLSPRFSPRLALLALVHLAISTGCVVPYVPLPTLSAEINAQSLDEDERYLWKKSSELQYEIESGGLLFEDRDLDRYLARALERVTPAELIAAGVKPRVAVISDVQIHGYSFANGVIYLHTALLGRMETETQLATVLSRELAHVVNRHALRDGREKKMRADTMAWVGIGTGLAGDYGSGAQLLAQAFEISSALGFPVALETQADRKGLGLLADAGYDVKATPAFFQGTVDYLAEIHTQGPWAWVAFTPPPLMTSRISGYQSLIETEYAGPASPTQPPIAPPDQFRRVLHRATLRQADLELAAGLSYSAANTARLATKSDARDPAAWHLLGKALDAQRANPIVGKTPATVDEIREAFRTALNANRNHAESVRDLAMTYYRAENGERSESDLKEATRLFKQYLRLAPNAGDTEYIRGYLAELERIKAGGAERS